MDIVRDALLRDVPAGFPAAERVVLDVLDEPCFDGWILWPTTEFIAWKARETTSTRDFDAAMTLLARLTVGLTGEFAVRDLLNARPDRALRVMHTWTEHGSEHVRRLATEGSRGYLPWAKRVPWLLAHPRATRGILDAACRDPAEYVRRSVANHLNDLSRVDPAANGSVSQRNALRSAQDYLSFPAFSHSGLIEQLEYEGFSTADATWAVDNVGADWNAQAAKSAEEYLEFLSFSRSGLIDQLVYEGFTR